MTGPVRVCTALALLASVAACSDDTPTGPFCDAASLSRALADASPGDTVRVGACRFGGTFTVPAGVTLAGTSRDESVLAVAADQIGITLSPGSSAAVLRDITIESQGSAALIARGTGSVEVRGVTIRATRGLGFGAEDLETLTLTDVALSGPITADNATEVVPDAGGSDTATHGLVVIEVNDVQLSNVSVNGFARFGFIAVLSNITWAGGNASTNLGTGAMFYGGVSTLTDVTVCGTLQGINLIPAYAMVISNDASVETDTLEICDNEGYGLLHDRATAQHVDLLAHDNAETAVWIQTSVGVEISGSETQLVNNAFAGIVAVDSQQLTVRDARIEDTQLATRVFGANRVDVGDGIQLVGDITGVALENVELSNNSRVGLLIDLEGGAVDDFTINGVSVSGTNGQLGAIAQNGTIAETWDADIERDEVVEANDSDFTGSLPIVGLVGPNDLPASNELSANGLDALVGPND